MSYTEDDNQFLLEGASKRNKNKAKIYKKSIFCKCDDRLSVEEYFEDFINEDFSLNADGLCLKTCSADLVGELCENGFTDV